MTGYLDELNTEALLKLLNNSKEVKKNEPFANFLDQFQIYNGSNLVEPKLLIQLYKATRKRNSITEKKALEFLQVKYVKGLPYFSINLTEQQIKNKIKVLKPKKKIEIDWLLKKKFENFITQNVSYTFQRYNEWFAETRRANPLTREEFKQLHKLYFSTRSCGK